MGASGGPSIVHDSSLVAGLEAADKNSYRGSGTTWTDLSPNGNDGTLTSGPTFDSGVGGSIVFDGGDDYVSVGDIGDVFGTSFAVAMWVNPDDVDNRREFIGQYADSNNWWRWGNDELDNWEIDVQDGGSRTVSVNPDWTVVAGAWQHIALSRNGSTWNFYRNGVLDGTGDDASTVPDVAAVVQIGNSTGDNFDGKMSSAQIYNRTLSTKEISQNFNAQRSRFGV